MKKVLITGSRGFIGRNLLEFLSSLGDIDIVEFTKQNSLEELGTILPTIDFIYHLAGVNRPLRTEEFYEGNTGLTGQIIALIESKNLIIPMLYTSSVYAEADNDYGRSKRQAEELLIEYSKKNCVPVYIYRLPNVFGKWSRPNYNSVVSTFCYNISHGLDIEIHEPAKIVQLVYIDDVVKAFAELLSPKGTTEASFYSVSPVYRVTVGELAEKIKTISDIRKNLTVPDLSDRMTKLLHTTYLSYLDNENFAYDLDEKSDLRGRFIEVLKSQEGGQVSISYSKPGVIRGNHYHNTKNEKFIVIKGKAKISFRNIRERTVTEYLVFSEKPQVIDIPPGYTHNIENIGEDEMILLIWANECFDPDKPDTFYCEVKK